MNTRFKLDQAFTRLNAANSHTEKKARAHDKRRAGSKTQSFAISIHPPHNFSTFFLGSHTSPNKTSAYKLYSLTAAAHASFLAVSVALPLLTLTVAHRGLESVSGGADKCR